MLHDKNNAAPYRVCFQDIDDQYRILMTKPSMHTLSERMVEASTVVPSPPPASARINHRPFTSLLKDQWNQQTASIYRKFRSVDDRLLEWGWKILRKEES